MDTTNDNNCCAEFARASAVTRRGLLKGAAAAGAAGVLTSMFGDALRQATFAATTGGNVLVVISLRGGIDGLGMVVPHGDPSYYTARPHIAVPRTSLVAQDPFFGLHPAMKSLEPLFRSGSLAAVHAVGLEHPNRSHFAAIEEIEDADPTATVRRGWVNRMIGLDTAPTSVAESSGVEALHLTSAIVPPMLVGPGTSIAMESLSRIELAGATGTHRLARRRQLNKVWQNETGPLGAAARAAFVAVDKLSPIGAQRYVPANGAVYPTTYPATGIGAALKDTAHLIKADVGTEVVSIDYGSWDMHTDYGSASTGHMSQMVKGFADSLNAFMTDLGTLRSRVTVVTMSEFGRRVSENGSRGLDHGWGNMVLLAGGGVRGGRYYGQWPGLGAGKLVDGDLKVTTDYRNVLGEVVTRRFPDRSIAQVFPGLAYSPLGLMT
jgi:uncharacterized protein (DUF1501 family)